MPVGHHSYHNGIKVANKSVVVLRVVHVVGCRYIAPRAAVPPTVIIKAKQVRHVHLTVLAVVPPGGYH